MYLKEKKTKTDTYKTLHIEKMQGFSVLYNPYSFMRVFTSTLHKEFQRAEGTIDQI